MSQDIVSQKAELVVLKSLSNVSSMDFKSLSSADSPEFTKTQSEEDPEKRLQQFDRPLKLTLTNIDCEEDDEIELSQELHHEEPETLPIPDSPDISAITPPTLPSYRFTGSRGSDGLGSDSESISQSPNFKPLTADHDITADNIEKLLMYHKPSHKSIRKLKGTEHSISRTSLVDGDIETKTVIVPGPRQSLRPNTGISPFSDTDESPRVENKAVNDGLVFPGCGSPTFYRDRSRGPSLTGATKRPFRRRERSVDNLNRLNSPLPMHDASSSLDVPNRSSSVLGALPDIEPSLSQDCGPDIEDQEVVKISNIILQHFEKTADANLPLLIINFAFLCVKCQSFLGGHYCPHHYVYECGECWEKSCCQKRGECSLCCRTCHKCKKECCGDCLPLEEIECRLCRLKSRLAPD